MKTAKLKLLLCGATLLLLAGISSCSKKDATPVVVKTDLEAAITAANTLLSTTHEGVAAGDYLKGSRAPFAAATAAAQSVLVDPHSTQAQVSAAIANLAGAIATYATNLVTAIDPTNLVGQWTFDVIAAATVGTIVKDYSGNGHDGTLKAGHAFWGAGTPTLDADRYGNNARALHFNKGGNVEIPYSTSLNPPIMSLSLWAKPDVNNPIVNNQYFISMNRWNGWKFNFQDTPRAFFTATYDDPAIPVTHKCCYDRDQNVGTAPQGAWHHYVVTFGGGHEVFYIDGLLVNDWSNTPGTISLLTTGVNLVFGQDLPTSVYVTTPSSDPNYVNYGGFYIGALDEVRIYKSVLTQAQVTSIYNLEKP